MWGAPSPSVPCRLPGFFVLCNPFRLLWQDLRHLCRRRYSHLLVVSHGLGRPCRRKTPVFCQGEGRWFRLLLRLVAVAAGERMSSFHCPVNVVSHSRPKLRLGHKILKFAEERHPVLFSGCYSSNSLLILDVHGMAVSWASRTFALDRLPRGCISAELRTRVLHWCDELLDDRYL